ncbi:ulp1 protease family, C-terminal catalytic domain-containing protein [Tanacetum coccineum]
MKIKAEVKRKRKGGSDSDSDSVDEEKLRRVLKKLKKIKTEYSDEESGLKSNKKGFSSFHNVSIDKIPSRLGRYALSKFSSTTYWLTFKTGDYVEVTPSKIHDILGIPVGGKSLFLLDVRPIEHEFVRSWVDQFYPKSLKEIRVGDIASKVISAQQVDFLFKVNFLTLFTNTTGRVVGLKGHIFLDVVRRLREESVISEIDWCGYIHSCLEDSELPEKPTLHYLGPFRFLILLYLDSIKFDRFPVVRTRPAIRDWTSTLMRKRQDLETKEHALFKKAKQKLALICSERVVLEDLMRKASSDYPDGGNDSDRDDDGDDDNNDGNGNNDEELNDDNDDGNGNNDEELNVDNDDGNGNNDEELNDDNDDGNGNNDGELNDEDTLGSNPSFGFSKIGLDDFEKQPSQEGTDAKKESVDPTQEGTVVELNPAEECEIMSTPENYTQWLERNADLVGEIIDAITDEYLYGPPISDRMPTRASNASASPGKRIVKPSSYLLSPYMNKKTKVVPKITRLEFSNGNSLFAMQGDQIFSNQVKAKFKGNEDGLALQGVDLVFFPICNHGHFYVVVFSLTSTTSMTILDNSVANYDTKYKEVCDLLKKLFVRHLKLYGHSRHGTVGRLKHRIPKLKWRTSRNFHDCGVFTMLHMESFNGETTAKWDYGLFVESSLHCDMLRRLRFKFATKILLHEINMHSKKMLELANEFDKVDSLERMAIIVEAVKNREERDRI